MLPMLVSLMIFFLGLTGVLSSDIQVTPFENGFGAAIIGAHLNSLSDSDFDIIHDALLRYRVIVVRQQEDLTVENQRSFTKRFGELHVHLESSSHLPGYKDVNVVSNIKNENGAYIGLYGAHVENLHSDLSWHARPTKVTVVKSVIRPEECGDTVFADSTSAYDKLPADLKEQAEGAEGIFSYLKLRQISASGESDNLAASEVQKAHTPSLHPLITTHPITGRKNIYANPSHTVSVVGQTEEQSAALLERLFNHTAEEQFSYRHTYQEGDVLVWDNRAVHHRATGCPDEFPRKLVRTTASNDDVPRARVEVVRPFDLSEDRKRSEYYHPQLIHEELKEEL